MIMIIRRWDDNDNNREREVRGEILMEKIWWDVTVILEKIWSDNDDDNIMIIIENGQMMITSDKMMG